MRSADRDTLARSMSRPHHRAQPPQHPSPPLFTGGVGLAGRLWDSFMGRFNTASSSSADPDVLAHSMSGTRHEAQPPQPPSPPLFAGGVGLAGRLWDSFVCKFNTAISRVRQEFTEETFDLPRVSLHSYYMLQAWSAACCPLCAPPSMSSRQLLPTVALQNSCFTASYVPQKASSVHLYACPGSVLWVELLRLLGCRFSRLIAVPAAWPPTAACHVAAGHVFSTADPCHHLPCSYR